MNKKSKPHYVEALVAAISGFGYFYYIYNLAHIKTFNPHVVFFLLILAMFITSLIIRKEFFVGILSMTAVGFWIVANSGIIDKIGQMHWILT